MITTPLTVDLLRGHETVEQTTRGLRPHRLPPWVLAQFPDPQLLSMESQPAGVRLAILTTARTVELVVHPTRLAYAGLDRPRGSIDLLLDGRPAGSDPLDGGDVVEVELRTGATEVINGPSHVARFAGLPAGEKRIELWLPHNESVELVELRTDATVAPAPREDGRLWLHHGSSISQGSNAASPSQIWPAVAARAAGVELRNLGLGGSALIDPFMARVIRDSPADLISLKFGVNVVNHDAMRLRTLVPALHGFLDTIREGHPTAPLVIISAIFCGIHEDTPGPGTFDPEAFSAGQVRFVATGQAGDVANGRLTLRVIRDAIASVVDHRSDPNLWHLDGTALYGPDDAETLPLPDALHPDSATHELIGRRFAEYAFGGEGPFAGS